VTQPIVTPQDSFVSASQAPNPRTDILLIASGLSLKMVYLINAT